MLFGVQEVLFRGPRATQRVQHSFTRKFTSDYEGIPRFMIHGLLSYSILILFTIFYYTMLLYTTLYNNVVAAVLRPLQDLM